MLFSVKLMHLAMLLGKYRKEGKTIFCERCENYYVPRIQQVYEEREGWNQFAGLHGKVVESSQSWAKIFPVAEGTKWTCVGD